MSRATVSEDGQLHGRPNGLQGSSRFAILGGRNALIMVPIGDTPHEPGDGWKRCC
ncbi:MAG: hypothetical protein R2845_02315 [Thermomicrobiales bacterium]